MQWNLCRFDILMFMDVNVCFREAYRGSDYPDGEETSNERDKTPNHSKCIICHKQTKCRISTGQNI